LTQEANELIINLIKVNAISRAQIYYLLTQMLELWKLNLATCSIPTIAFVDNMKFIKQTILDTYNELARNANHVYRRIYVAFLFQFRRFASEAIFKKPGEIVRKKFNVGSVL